MIITGYLHRTGCWLDHLLTKSISFTSWTINSAHRDLNTRLLTPPSFCCFITCMEPWPLTFSHAYMRELWTHKICCRNVWVGCLKWYYHCRNSAHLLKFIKKNGWKYNCYCVYTVWHLVSGRSNITERKLMFHFRIRTMICTMTVNVYKIRKCNCEA